MKWILLLAAVCIGCALGDKEKVSKVKSKFIEPKLKREAPIRSGSSYHGPSYKYLPPSSSSHASNFLNDHHSISGDKGSYDFGNLISGGTHGYGPKVETYIVQTESSPEGFGGGAGSHGHVSAHGIGSLHGLNGLHSFSGSQRGSLGGIGYKYAAPSASYSNGHIGNSNNFGSSYAVGQGPVHKIKTIVIPAHGFSTDGHGSSGQSRFGMYSTGYSTGYSLPKDLAGGSHYSQYAGNEHGGQGSDFTSGYNAGHLSGSDFSGTHGYHNYEHGNDATYRETDFSGVQDSYSYEPPSQTFSHSQSHIGPSSSYGVPDVSGSTYHSGSTGQQAPIYAVGHKGLGHFGYSASRPQALNTNFIDSSRYGGSFSKYEHGSHGSAHDASRAPFRPSLFLGASHESSSSAGSISSEYGPPAGEQNISQQYLPPPTSEGYDYQTPSALYGAPQDSHAHGGGSGRAHEPENNYLPPSIHQTSYGPPATPDQSYLPPHH